MCMENMIPSFQLNLIYVDLTERSELSSLAHDKGRLFLSHTLRTFFYLSIGLFKFMKSI